MQRSKRTACCASWTNQVKTTCTLHACLDASHCLSKRDLRLSGPDWPRCATSKYRPETVDMGRSWKGDHENRWCPKVSAVCGLNFIYPTCSRYRYERRQMSYVHSGAPARASMRLKLAHQPRSAAAAAEVGFDLQTPATHTAASFCRGFFRQTGTAVHRRAAPTAVDRQLTSQPAVGYGTTRKYCLLTNYLES